MRDDRRCVILVLKAAQVACVVSDGQAGWRAPDNCTLTHAQAANPVVIHVNAHASSKDYVPRRCPRQCLPVWNVQSTDVRVPIVPDAQPFVDHQHADWHKAVRAERVSAFLLEPSSAPALPVNPLAARHQASGRLSAVCAIVIVALERTTSIEPTLE